MGEAAVRVMTTLPVPGAAMLVCESAAVTPEGSPLTERFKAELNPPPAAVRMVKAALVPGRRTCDSDCGTFEPRGKGVPNEAFIGKRLESS